MGLKRSAPGGGGPAGGGPGRGPAKRPARPGAKGEGPEGGDGAGAPRRAARPEKDPYAEEAAALADEFIEWAPAKVDEAVADLDFSIDSIRVLDRACRFQRKGFDDRYVLCAGFYFGEMLRRTYKGRYRWDEKAGALALDLEGLSIFPIEKIRKVVSGQDNASLQEFLLILARRIADRRGYGKSAAPAQAPPEPG